LSVDAIYGQRGYPNITVIAPNGFAEVTRNKDGKAYVSGTDSATGTGQWITFQNGKIVRRENFTLGKSPSGPPPTLESAHKLIKLLRSF